MIGIKSVASYVPDTVIDNYQQAKNFGESNEFVENKIGAVSLPRKKKEQDTSDLAMHAVQALFEKNPDLEKDKVDALVVVTQNPDEAGLPHTAAILQNKLGLPVTIAAFDVSLGCSGYIYGLFLLKGFLEASGLVNGILVTCDPYSKIVNPDDRITSMLFGDAATATWLGNEPDWVLDAVSYGTDGAGAEHLKVVDKHLSMNGRQVFNFAATQVAPHINNLLEKEEVEAKDVDLYCLHQGSAAIVDAIARRFGNLSSRFIKDIKNTGNTVSSSIPLLLEKNTNDKKVKRIVLSGFGVGLSIATAIISRSDKDK